MRALLITILLLGACHKDPDHLPHHGAQHAQEPSPPRFWPKRLPIRVAALLQVSSSWEESRQLIANYQDGDAQLEAIYDEELPPEEELAKMTEVVNAVTAREERILGPVRAAQLATMRRASIQPQLDAITNGEADLH